METPRKDALPWWTWVLPFLIFHLGTGLSLKFQAAPGMSLWYLPIPLALILVQWWGPRILVGLYLNAMLCAGYWGLYRWWLWPLYAIPETLKVGFSWWMFNRMLKGKPWLPDLPNTTRYLVLGVGIPCIIGSFLGQGLLTLLGDVDRSGLLRRAYAEFVLDVLSPFAITVPALLFGTAWLERYGLSITRGAFPRPTLIFTELMGKGQIWEACAVFISLLFLSLSLSLERFWFVHGFFLMWAAIRFGIGVASLATVWTIVLALPLPAMLAVRETSAWINQNDLLKMNLNLATLCFAALVVGRALSDLRLEIKVRAQAESDLRKSQSLLEHAQDLAKIGYVYVEPATGVRVWSRNLKRFYGLDPDGPDPDREQHIKILGGQASGFADGERILMEQGEYQNEEMLVTREDGTSVTLRVVAKRTLAAEGRPLSIAAVFQDVTEWASLRRKVREEEDKYRILFESASDAIVLGREGVFTDCNGKALEMFGARREEFVGAPTSRYFPAELEDGGDAVAELARIRADAMAGKAQTFEWRMRKLDGSLFYTEVTMAAVPLGAKPMTMAVVRDITKRREMEQALLDNESKYRTLFEAATDAIFISEVGKGIVDCNEAALRIFRCQPDYIIGKPATVVSPERQPNGVPSADGIMSYRMAAMEGKAQRFEWTFKRPDGSLFEAETSLTAVNYDGVRKLLVVIRDISARKVIERALIESEERFRQMAENIQEVFFLMDCADGAMLYVSPLAKSILGVSVPEIADRPSALSLRVHADDRGRAGFLDPAALGSRPYNEDFRFMRPDGKERWLRMRSFLIPGLDGKPYRVAGVVADITEYKVAQEESRSNQQRLIQADKMNSLGLMVSGVAHEVNNPNNLIMLNADVLDTFWKHMRPVLREHAQENPDWNLAGIPYGGAEGKFETLLGGVSGGAKRIKRIVDNLKDFARIDGGDLSEAVALDKVVEASVGIVENLIRKSTDSFTVAHGNDIPKVLGNFQKLEQVLINLITNACQSLETRSKAVRVITWHEKDTGLVGIRVEDEGKGIPAALLHKVSDPFFTTKRDTGGTGLGLSVTYGIIREHRGQIEIKSEENRGTTIEVRIPALQERQA